MSNNLHKENKTAIIGAGLGGLATAARIAAKGHSVDVYEKNATFGGKVGEIETNGYRFDSGPSLLTMLYVFEELFADCGKNLEDYLEIRPLESSCKYFFEENRKVTDVTFYTKSEKLVAEVTSKLDVSERQVRKYFDRSRYIFLATKRVFLESNPKDFRTYLSLDTFWQMLKLPWIGAFASLNGFNQRFFDDPRMVQILNRYATYNGSDPYQTPGVISLLAHVENHLGAFYPVGGIRKLPEAVYNLCQDLGVNFYFGKPVDSIVARASSKFSVKKPKIVGIELDGEFLEYDSVVSNVDVEFTYRNLFKEQELDGNQKPVIMGERFLNRFAKETKSSSVVVFYWGINKQFKNLDVHNILFAADYKAEFKYIFSDPSATNKWVYKDPTVYINISSKYSPKDAPEGGENWFVLVNVPSIASKHWEKAAQELRDIILKKIERVLGESIEENIEFEEILNPHKIQERDNSLAGAIYGQNSNFMHSAFARYPNQSTKYQNLSFVGGTVHPGGGMPLVVLGSGLVVG